MSGSGLPQAVEGFLWRHDVRGQGLVVAVSGGADSVALARALASLSPAVPLVLAHLNHLLRGPESNADEAFVRGLAGELGQGVGLCVEHLDVAERARQGGQNLEEKAREERYRWLAEVARRHGLSLVATGHTTDDQAETVLHRLLRGTGLQGLRGIAARRPLAPGIELIRPLLSVTRADVLAYLETLGQGYRVDSSNSDLAFTRNRIRHQLLPLLASEYNPAVAALLCRLAEQADEAHDELVAAAEALLGQAERPRSSRWLVFDLPTLRAASRARVRQLFRVVWQREGWPVSAMHFERWKDLERVVFGVIPAVDLPGGIHSRRRRQALQLGPRRPED